MTFSEAKNIRTVVVKDTLTVANGGLRYTVPVASDLVDVFVQLGTASANGAMAEPAGPVTVQVTKNATVVSTVTVAALATAGSALTDRTPVDLVSAPSQANFATGYWDDQAAGSDTIQTSGGIDDYSVTTPNLSYLASYAAGDYFKVNVTTIGDEAGAVAAADLTVTLVFDPR